MFTAETTGHLKQTAGEQPGAAVFIRGVDKSTWCVCSLIHKMMCEQCLREDTVFRVLVIGLCKDLPLSPADAMDIADVLVARAANAHTDGE